LNINILGDNSLTIEILLIYIITSIHESVSKAFFLERMKQES